MDSVKANSDPEVDLLPPVWRRWRIVFLAKNIIVTALHKSKPRTLSSKNVTETYMEECIHRGLSRAYEEEATETLNNAQARGDSVERLRLLAQVLMAEEIIDSTFRNTYMSDLDELEKHRFGEDEPALAEDAQLDPQLAEELMAFMDADDTRAAKALVNALNQGQCRVFDIFLHIFNGKLLRMVRIFPDIAAHQVEALFRNCVLFSQGLWEPASLTLFAC